MCTKTTKASQKKKEGEREKQADLVEKGVDAQEECVIEWGERELWGRVGL